MFDGGPNGSPEARARRAEEDHARRMPIEGTIRILFGIILLAALTSFLIPGASAALMLAEAVGQITFFAILLGIIIAALGAIVWVGRKG